MKNIIIILCSVLLFACSKNIKQDEIVSKKKNNHGQNQASLLSDTVTFNWIAERMIGNSPPLPYAFTRLTWSAVDNGVAIDYITISRNIDSTTFVDIETVSPAGHSGSVNDLNAYPSGTHHFQYKLRGMYVDSTVIIGNPDPIHFYFNF